MANKYNLGPSQNTPNIVEATRSAFDSALGSARRQFTDVNAYLSVAKQYAHAQLLKAQTNVYSGEFLDSENSKSYEAQTSQAIKLLEVSTNDLDTDPDSFGTGMFIPNIFDNILLRSNLFVPDFFSNTGTDYKEIRLPIFLGTIGIAYSNKYSKTSSLGGKGTLKHFAGATDLKIDISGVFVSDFKGMDRNNVSQNKNISFIKDFLQMCVNYKTVNVEHPLLTDELNMNLDNCVIESFSLPDSTKYKNLQEFKLSLTTDTSNFLPTPEVE